MGGKICLTLEYEGTRYHGFQIQAEMPTIQGELEHALWKLTGENIRVTCASRTDAGVHAKGQIVTFKTLSNLSPQTFVKALNFYLPEDIVVKDACRVTNNFNVRRDVLSREYRYTILNSATPSAFLRKHALFVAAPLDVEAMNEASRVLLGKHDFSPFTYHLKRPRNTIRTVYKAEVKREGELIFFDMVANSFLPQQVRRTIGALLRVGIGKMSVMAFWELANSRKPGVAAVSAPPHGLCLMKVNYKVMDDENL
jgi:tRNA pseudouridine38-40 synthase